MNHHEGGLDDPLQHAYEFAWKGFQTVEYEALEQFGTVTANLSVNPDETGEDEPVENTTEDSIIVTQESVTTYEMVDVAVASAGRQLAVGLGQLTTISTITPIEGGVPALEMIVQNRAEVMDTSFDPPMPTGEEYVRPPITLVMTSDGEDVESMHFTSPERPDTYDHLLKAREDQKRYVALLGLVGAARIARGEITG
jgi:hypothetical protein